MRRAAGIALVAALALVPGAAAGAGETPIGVRAQDNGDWALLLSRSVVDPGPAEIQYLNQGEDPHDLKIRRRGSADVLSIAELQPAGVAEIDLRLRSDSRYVMWCSTLGGKHRALGMETELRVRRR
jgi:hypothetical protein